MAVTSAAYKAFTGTYNSGVADVTLTAPASVAVGDKLFAILVDTLATSGTSVTPPSGWTAAPGVNHVVMGTRNFEVYTHTYTQAEATAGTKTWKWTQSANSAVAGVILAVSGGVDTSGWTWGSYMRGSTGSAGTTYVSSTSQTTPGISATLPAGTMVISIKGEATAATETDAQVTLATAGWTKDFWYQNSSSPTNTVLVAHKILTAAGPSGDLVSSWLNATANRGSIMVAIPPVASAVPSLPGKIVDGSGAAVSGVWQLWDGTALQEFSSMQLVRVGRKVPDLFKDGHKAMVAHRLDSIDYAEHSLRGATQSCIAGVDALEFSVARSLDGKYFGLHDATLNRTNPTAPAAYNPAEHNWAEILGYLSTVNYAGATVTAQPLMLLDDLISIYGKTHTIFIDPKVIGSTYYAELITKLKTFSDYRNTFVGKYFHTGLGVATAFRNAGMKSWGYAYSSDVGAVDANGNLVVRPVTDTQSLAYTAQFWDFLGQEVGGTQAVWDATKAIANGKKVIGHIPQTLVQAQSGITKGADGLMLAGVEAIMPTYYIQ